MRGKLKENDYNHQLAHAKQPSKNSFLLSSEQLGRIVWQLLSKENITVCL